MVSIARLDIADVRDQGCAGGLVHVLDGVVRPPGEAVSSYMLLAWNVHRGEPVKHELGFVAEQPLIGDSTELLCSEGTYQGFVIKAELEVRHPQ